MDGSTFILIQALETLTIKTEQPGNILWVADESFDANISTFIESPHAFTFISNRIDVHQSITNALNAASCNLNVSIFNDYDFSSIASQKFDAIFYRLSKEKMIVHHILINTLPLLKPEGCLYISGKKTDGIKGYSQSIKKKLSLQFDSKKIKDNYVISICNNQNNSALLSDDNHLKLLQDTPYHSYQPITCAPINDPLLDDLQTNIKIDLNIYSKPGVYGWKKIDAGTLLLLETFINIENINNLDKNTCLDLGCGSGLIALYMKKLGFSLVVATDNNATAIDTTTYNAKKNNVDIEVVADDCAKGITHYFDYIFCNPPFHKGFETQKNLTQMFVAQASERLNKKGQAWFVVNSFIGIEKIANHYFNSQETIINNSQFKVLKCIK